MRLTYRLLGLWGHGCPGVVLPDPCRGGTGLLGRGGDRGHGGALAGRWGGGVPGVGGEGEGVRGGLLGRGGRGGGGGQRVEELVADAALGRLAAVARLLHHCAVRPCTAAKGKET